MRFLLATLALAALPSASLAQTVTANLPAVVNPQGQPRPVPAGFTLNADGSIQNMGPNTSAGSAIVPVVGSLVASINGKGSAGNLYSVSITTGTANGYLYVFNSTTEPADGAVVAGNAAGNYQVCSAVAATTTFTSSFEFPERYSVGIRPVFSSTACGTLTKATTAVFIKARAQ